MMLSSNLNGSFQQAYQVQHKIQLQQQHHHNQAQQSFAQSVDSTSSSVGASSLLTAANTLIFNSPVSSSSSLTGSYIKSPFVFTSTTHTNKSVSQSPKQKPSSGSFSRQLLELQNLNQASDLDFDLHYNLPQQQQQLNPLAAKSNSLEASEFKLSKLDEINFNLNQQQQLKKTSNTKYGDYLFQDDEDPIELENDDDDEDVDEQDEESSNITDDFEKEDDSSSMSSVFSFKRMTNQNKVENSKSESIIGRILNNPIAYSNNNRMLPNQSKLVSMNVPIETINENSNNNNGSNIVGSIKKVNFFSEVSPMNSYIGASATPTSTSNCHFNDSTPQNSVPTSKTRTLMKLQLMKQQTEQSEKKAAAASLSSNPGNVSAAMNHNNNMSSNISFINKRNSINEISTDTILPSSLTSSEIIPRNSLPQAFQTETKLEYPTKYHVMQIAKSLQQSCTTNTNTNNTSINNVTSPAAETTIPKSKVQKQQQQQQYIRQQQKTSSNSNSYREAANSSLASSGDIAILPNSSSYYSDCAFNEKFSQHSIDSNDLNQMSSPTSSSFSQADYVDEIDDLVPNNIGNKRSMSTNLTNLEIQEEINRIEECLNLPKTLPTDYLKIMSPSTSQSVRASTSCPTDIARLKRLKGLNLTQDEIKLIVKDRQKKDNHNMIERRRRFNINDRIKELGSILPKPNQGEIKQNKGSILKASVDYIKNLQYEVNKIKELGEQFNQMTILNRKLVNRIKELEREKQQINYITINESDETTNTKRLNIKQEPFLSKSLNLVQQQHNEHQPQQMSMYYLSASQQLPPTVQQQFQQHQQNNSNNFAINNQNETISTTANEFNDFFSTHNQHMNMENDDALFNGSLLDEILNEAIKTQHINDLNSNNNNNDQYDNTMMMDSLNN